VLPCAQVSQGDSTHCRKVTGVLAAVSSSPTGQTTSKTLQLVIHAPIVVSSCGAIHTPALLLRSGVTVGGNVGTNLRLHPATGVLSVFDRTPEQAAAGRGAVEMHKVSWACQLCSNSLTE
jgi:long-chain-alcohol oxidase